MSEASRADVAEPIKPSRSSRAEQILPQLLGQQNTLSVAVKYGWRRGYEELPIFLCH